MFPVLFSPVNKKIKIYFILKSCFLFYFDKSSPIIFWILPEFRNQTFLSPDLSYHLK
jgi:hypothetical protein